MEWPENLNDNQENFTETHSFFEYMDIFEKSPKKECRPTFLYLLEMLEYFGKDKQGHYKIFKEEHDDSSAIYGQFQAQEEIVRNLLNFKEEGINNKFLLLVGPNGSSKSSLVRKMIKGTELYSESTAGALYSFSWVFPIDHLVKGKLGLANVTPSDRNVKSYAHLDDIEINAILPSDMKDHPLLLLPLEFRKKFITDALKDDAEYLETIKQTALFKSDLSKRNRMIYNAMLKNYKGNHTEVLKHIRVERFTISKRYSTGAVTIEPQIHVDARLQQITMDKRLASLPPGLQSLNLFSMHGELVMANRGILEYSDLLKRPLDTYKYLLMTMETGNINLQGILTELDIFFIGTSNEVHLAAFKQHPDYNSFKGRFNFIRVPYLLNYNEEMKIYKKQVATLKDKCDFTQDALKALCFFSIMCRLRGPQSKNYHEKKLSDIAIKLNPLEKCLLLGDGEMPGYLNVEDKQILAYGLKDLRNEFKYENLYEGKFGPSPRDMKNFIYELANSNENVSLIEILDFLEKITLRANEFDFLNMTSQGDYHHPVRFISLIKEHFVTELDKKLRSALGLVDDRSYEEHLKRYIENINSQIKGEKIKNEITGKYEESDQYFIVEFEKSISLKEDAVKFRSFLISKLGAYYLDHPGQNISYQNVFPDLVEKLQESFRIEQEKMIKIVSANIVFYEKEIVENEDSTKKQMNAKHRDMIDKILDNLMSNCDYNKLTAFSLLKYIISEKY